MHLPVIIAFYIVFSSSFLPFRPLRPLTCLSGLIFYKKMEHPLEA